MKSSVFCLWVFGEEFDLDGFLSSSTWSPNRVWRRGDRRDRVHPGSPEPHSGLELAVANGALLSTEDQHALAIQFLEENENELVRLNQHGHASRLLGIDVRSSRYRDATMFSFSPPSRLLRLLTELDVQLEYFVVRSIGIDQPDE